MRLIDADLLKSDFVTDTPQGCGTVGIKYVDDLIDRQPTVNQWIPCNERLPDVELDDAMSKRGNDAIHPILATIKKRKFNNEEYCITERAFYLEYYGERIFSDGNLNKLNVIAWQPLPEPYKKEV